MTPPLVAPFLLTLAVSFLIGIGLREYYEIEHKSETFGTVRTFVFIGMLGFVLFELPEIGGVAFLVGFGVLTAFLLVYYVDKVRERKSLGLIGVSIALLTYVTGPTALLRPAWFVVLLAISVLLVLHAKGRIRSFTNRLATGEVVTLCKFLAIVGVALPLIPSQPAAGGVGRFLALLPLTPRQIWMAVVVTTAVSYLGYVLQTYFLPRKGLLLAGLLGGLYSSTVTVLVLARKSRAREALAGTVAVAVLLAVAMMYLRLLVLVAILRFTAIPAVSPALLGLSALAAGYALWLRRRLSASDADEVAPSGDGASAPAARRNPLELSAALLFAGLLVVIALATKLTLASHAARGLRLLSFAVGFSDITPFVVSLLQGRFGIDERAIVQAIVIASASNNLLKTVYIAAFGARRAAWLAAPGLVGLAVLALAVAFLVL